MILRIDEMISIGTDEKMMPFRIGIVKLLDLIKLGYKKVREVWTVDTVKRDA